MYYAFTMSHLIFRTNTWWYLCSNM